VSIKISGLSKIYGEQKAVDNISFTVGSNEIVGFLGPNGAGKTTTMKMITGFLNPDQGKIEICGIPVVPGSTETKKITGYLPEANPLYLDLYVKEYLSFVAGVHKIKNSEKRINTVIEMVGLNPERQKKIGQLSKGYKQRVGLAGAMLHDPKVLILDEPTSGLDPNQITEIRDVIRELGKTKTILFSSHIMQEVEALCERVIILNKGNIVADDQLINLKIRSREQHNVQVQFKEKITADYFSALNSFDNIKTLPGNVYVFETNDPDSLKKQLLNMSLDKQLNIISITSDTNDLEQVFKSLTS
jgi:ABC-2 type transport system ATP-binding protein